MGMIQISRIMDYYYGYGHGYYYYDCGHIFSIIWFECVILWFMGLLWFIMVMIGMVIGM